MELKEYIRSRGIKLKAVAQKLGVSRQAVERYGSGNSPSIETCNKVAAAMTELGAATTVIDIVTALKG